MILNSNSVNINETIGSRFLEQRKHLGLSQAKVAEICGVRREIVGRWKREQTLPVVKHLLRLDVPVLMSITYWLGDL